MEQKLRYAFWFLDCLVILMDRVVKNFLKFWYYMSF